MKYYLCSVYGSCRNGDRNGSIEEFDTLQEARKGIEDLLWDHPDATWKLIEGTEVERS